MTVRPAARDAPTAAPHWQVRPVLAADLPGLQPWLPDTAERQLLSAESAEGWWLAEDARGPAAVLRLRGPIGLRWPRHWYHVGCVVHAAPELNLFRRQTTLQLGNDHTGASELADAAADPARSSAEQAGAWQALLATARRHLAQHAAAHGQRVIAELPGLRDEHGMAPFWQGLGRHFHAGDPAEVLRQRGLAGRAALAALLPRQTVYASFLAPAAQAALGQAALPARSWQDALAQVGFQDSHHVDILDGGPVLEVTLDRWSLPS